MEGTIPTSDPFELFASSRSYRWLAACSSTVRVPDRSTESLENLPF